MQKAAAGISPPASLEKIQRHRVDFTSPTASSGTVVEEVAEVK